MGKAGQGERNRVAGLKPGLYSQNQFRAGWEAGQGQRKSVGLGCLVHRNLQRKGGRRVKARSLPQNRPSAKELFKPKVAAVGVDASNLAQFEAGFIRPSTKVSRKR